MNEAESNESLTLNPISLKTNIDTLPFINTSNNEINGIMELI